MAQMEDNLDNMRKNVLLVRERKNKLEVRSAIDGELGLLDVELGQNIQAGQNIGQINDLSNFKIEAKIDEHYIDRVRPGLTATITRDGKEYQCVCARFIPKCTMDPSAPTLSLSTHTPNRCAADRLIM